MRVRAISTGVVCACLAFGAASPARAQFYDRHDLVSDGALPADHVDSNLVNAWGLAASSSGPWWVSDNGSAFATIYDGNGNKIPLNVTVPGAPTGMIFNASGAGFKVNGSSAHFVFASEDGTISAWASGTAATIVVDESTNGAVFKGLAMAHNGNADFIYATNFHAGTVEVFDSDFTNVSKGFVDPALPAGYAPFGIQNIGGVIYVTYALQDEQKHDDVRGEGHGFIDAFDPAGTLIRRVASRGVLNSPWGLALAPADFGKFSGDLLVGNFGNGRIHAFREDKPRGNGQLRQEGVLHGGDGKPLEIDGLWALQFGNGKSAGPTTTLFFTAGPFDEQHGLFGRLTPARR
ncbi:MAG TPA: TIGR03118 family protein [Vicinamibacterales bacterium]